MYLIESTHSFVDWPDDTPKFGALVLFFAGCDFGCSGCHNVQFKSYAEQHHDTDYVLSYIQEKGRDLPQGRYNHIILSGGDPFGYLNRSAIKELISALTEKGYAVTVYTGQEAAWCVEHDIRGCTYIKCGKYNKNKAQPSGHRDGAFYLASSNQILLDADKNVVSIDGVYNYRG